MKRYQDAQVRSWSISSSKRVLRDMGLSAMRREGFGSTSSSLPLAASRTLRTEPGSPQQCMVDKGETMGIMGIEKFREEEKESLLPHKTVKQWSRLPHDAVQPPHMKVFETQWGKAQQDLPSSLTLH